MYSETNLRHHPFLLEAGIQNLQCWPWFSNQLIVCPWRMYLITLCLTLCICKMKIINIHLTQGMFGEFIIVKCREICGSKLWIKVKNGENVRWYAPALCLENCWRTGSMYCLIITAFRITIHQKMEYVRMVNKMRKLYSGGYRWFDF